jgi:integrase
MATARPLSHEEIERIGAALPSERDRLLWLFGFRTGLRVAELLSLRVRQVADGVTPRSSFAIERRFFKGGRGRKRRRVAGRVVKITEDMKPAIKAYLERYPNGFPAPSAPLFPSRKGGSKPLLRGQAWAIIKRACAAAGVADFRVSTHSWRKTYARALYTASGHDLLITQKLLGHADADATEAYLTPERDRMDELVDQISGRPLNFSGRPAEGVSPVRFSRTQPSKASV